MMTIMAIVIDSEKREIRLEKVVGPTLAFMQKTVGGYIERGIEFRNGDEIFVNEEGLLQGWSHGFVVTAHQTPFMGNGVVLSHDEEGETTSVKSSLEAIKRKVRFFGNVRPS